MTASVWCKICCTKVEEVMREVRPSVLTNSRLPYVTLILEVGKINRQTQTIYLFNEINPAYLIGKPDQMDRSLEIFEQHALQILDIGRDVGGLDSLLSGNAWGGVRKYEDH